MFTTITLGVAGLVAVLIVAALAASRRERQALFISRHVVFYVSVALGVLGYAALVAFGAYQLRERVANWGGRAELAFISAAVLPLLWLLSSTALRRRLRVFIATHFYRDKYDYRVEWLRFVQMLTIADEPDLRRTVINAVAQIVASPGGVLLLLDDSRERFEGHAAWPNSLGSIHAQVALDVRGELGRFIAETQWVVDLQEYAQFPERYDNIELPAWLDPRGPWRIVVPLLVGRELIGLLVLRAPHEPFAMTFEDRDLLKTVGRHVAVQLAQRNAVEKLAESRQFDAYNRFTAFVMHDLKNSIAQLKLVVANAARHRRDPAFVDDAISTIANAVERMTHLLEQLQSREAHGSMREVGIAASVRAAVQRAQTRHAAVEVRGELGDARVSADPERLASVLDHVVRNAQDATSGNGGAVWFELEANDGFVNLVIADEGSGMEPEFVRDRLFRPFDSTKGSKGMGIGAFQVREYVRSLGGDVEVESTPGRGTRFCIRLKTCQKTNRDS